MYKLHRSIVSTMEAVGEIASAAQEAISKGTRYVAKKAQEASSAVQERVGPSLSKASKGLLGTIRTVSGTIEKVASDATSVTASHWEWVKKEVEGRKK